MSEIDPVIFEFHARVNGYLADINRTTQTVDQKLGLQEKRVKSLEMQMQRSSTAIGGHLRGLAGALAGYFTGRELAGLLDSFTRLQNNLRVAGVEGANLKVVQDRLFDSAQKYGVELEGLSSLYSSLTQAGKELGASQDEIFTITDAVSASLKVTGISASQAGGALMQLQQVFRGSKVQAEEYNSLIDTLYPLLEAAANGSDRWKGSVGALTRDVKASSVTSQEFFRAILGGSSTLENKAAKATLSLSSGFTTLTNAITVYFGEADKANGVSAALGEALNKLADNLDTVIPALASIIVLMGARYVAAAASAVASTQAFSSAVFALQARAAGAATTVEALSFAGRGLLGALGGPVGAAITAVTLGLSYMAVKSATASTALKEQGESASVAAKFNKDLQAILNADPSDKTASSVRNLAGAHREAARAAYEHAAAEIAAQKAQGQRALRLAQEGKREVTKYRYEQVGNTRSRQRVAYTETEDIGRLPRVRGGEKNQPQNVAIREAQQQIADADRAAAELKKAHADAVKDVPKVSGPAVASSPSSKSTKATSGTSGPSASEIAQRHANDIARLEQEELQARIQLTTDVNERANLERELLASEYAQRKSEIDDNTDLSADQKQAQIGILQKLYGVSGALDAQGAILVNGKQALYAQQVERERQAQEERDIADLAEVRFRAQTDALRLQYELADTDAERQQVALKILAAEDEFLRTKLEAIKDSKVAGAVEKEKARLALESLNSTAGQRRQSVIRDNETPVQRYVRDLSKTPEQINEALDAIQLDGLQSLNDELADAIIGVKSLGDVFKNVADQIIADLLRIAIQQAIIKPLAGFLFGGMGGGGGGIFGFLGGLFGGGRANGGPVSAGTTYLVGERGPELLRMGSQSGFVVPNQAIRSSGQQGSGVAVVRLELTDDLDGRIVSVAGPIAVEVTRANAPAIADAGAAKAVRAMTRPRM